MLSVGTEQNLIFSKRGGAEQYLGFTLRFVKTI